MIFQQKKRHAVSQGMNKGIKCKDQGSIIFLFRFSRGERSNKRPLLELHAKLLNIVVTLDRQLNHINLADYIRRK